MSAAAEWAAISPYAPDPHVDARTAFSVSNLSWSQQQQAMGQAPILGGRRQWCDYSFELTGYGSLELCGPLAYRVTLVHPDDGQALRQLHRLVCSGRLQPLWSRGHHLDASRIHVIDRVALSRTGVDARGSWLFVAQAVARLCGTDDEIALIAGPALRGLLWAGREHLGSPDLSAAITELRRATADLAEERAKYVAALERRVRGDIDTIRREAQVLAQVRREWESAPPPGPSPGPTSA